MDNHKVSVIITTYNGSDRLRSAIESVLNQTYKNLELIVVDDNNPQTIERHLTENIMQEYVGNDKLQYICHPYNMNGAAARNTGMRYASGQYIAFLDDDDWYYPERISECVRVLNEDNSYGAVYTSVEVMRNNQVVKIREVSKSGTIWKDLLLNEGLLGTGSNIFLIRDKAEKCGEFDERFIRYQDVEFMLRYLQENSIKACNKILIRRIIKHKNKSNIPEYNKLKENKKLIFDKFSNLISQLNADEKLSFYESHYSALFESAVASCERGNIKNALADYKNIGHKLTNQEKIRATFPHIYKLYLNIRLRGQF